MTVIPETIVFAEPGEPSGGIKWDDMNGVLLMFVVTGDEKAILTTFGPADAIRADITVLDGDQAGDTYPECLVFPKVLAAQLRSKVGQKVLGRVEQGMAKANQSPPWLLSKPTEADFEVGVAYLTRTSAAVAAAPR